MSRTKKRFAAAVTTGFLCQFVIWCFGIDLTARGIDLGIAVIVTIYAVGCAATFPFARHE